MPINDNAVIYGTNAYILTALTTAAAPSWAAVQAVATSGGTTLPTGFTTLGHTTLDKVVAFASDGGDTEVKGSLQNRALREVLKSAAVDRIVVSSLQIQDNTVLTLYYGGGDATVANTFDVPDNPGVQERALLVVIVDAVSPVGLYVPRSSVRRDDVMAIPADDFASAPLRFTFLKATGKPRQRWLSATVGL